jgi:hypothetical protein
MKHNAFSLQEGHMSFVKAQVGPPNYGDPKSMYTVQYFDDQGNMMIRSGGTRAWRCNNPGNLLASSYSTSTKRRSIGRAGDDTNVYAVYPDYETGHEALVVMLRGGVYSPLTLRAAIKRYDSTNPKYIDVIISKTGFDPGRTIKSLDDEEFEKFWRAIEDMEKWEVGREDFIERWYITAVHMKRGVIQEYCICKNGIETWLAKQEAIALAQERRIHATVVHRSNGSLYLRPEYHGKRFREMVVFSIHSSMSIV